MADVQFDFNPVDWTGFSGSTVLPNGYALWFYNDPELGTSKRFLLIGDGSSTADNLPKLTYLEAGAELQALNNSGNYIDNRISCYANATTVLRVTILFDDIPKQDATTLTFPVGFSFLRSDGTVIYTVTAGESIPVTKIQGRAVSAVITTTGLTAGENGSVVGNNVSVTLS